MPKCESIERMPVTREVRELFVFRRIAVVDPGRCLPGEAIRALGTVFLNRVKKHFDVIGEQKVIIVKKIEPFATSLGQRDIAGTCSAHLCTRRVIAYVQPIAKALDHRLGSRRAVLDDHRLDMGPGLIGNCCQRLLKPRAAINGAYEYRYQRRLGAWSFA